MINEVECEDADEEIITKEESDYDDDESSSSESSESTEYMSKIVSDEESTSNRSTSYKTRTREELVNEINKLRAENNETTRMMDRLNYQTQLYCVRIEEANMNEQRLNDEIKRLQVNIQELHQKQEEVLELKGEDNGSSKDDDSVTPKEIVKYDSEQELVTDPVIMAKDSNMTIDDKSTEEESGTLVEGSDTEFISIDEQKRIDEELDRKVAELSRLAESMVPYEDMTTEIEEIKNQLDRISCDVKRMGNDP